MVLVSRSNPYAAAPTTRRRTAGGQPRRATPSADALFGLLVLDAEVRVGQRLQPQLLDGPSAPIAAPVRSFADLGEGLVDPLHQVTEVVDQREVSLALEGGGPGVRVLLVEAHLTGEIGLVGGERLLLQLV